MAAGGEFFSSDNYLGTCPGEVTEYSNAGVGLLGYVVELVSGVPFDEFVDQQIFAPLQLAQTSFRLADLDPSTLAVPYDRVDGGFRPMAQYGFPTYPDGLIRSPPAELGRFLAMMAQRGALEGYAHCLRAVGRPHDRGSGRR